MFLLLLTFILTKYLISNNIFSIFILIFLLIIYFYIINLNLKMNKFIKSIYIENNVREKKKIKVALCLTGRIDNDINKIYHNLKKNLLDHYDIDIFINADRDDDLIKKLYNPKKYVVYNKLIENNNLLDNTVNTMFYRIYECNKYTKDYEKKFNFTYDLIIRLRIDVNLNKRLYLENFLDNYIYFPVRFINGDSSNIYHLGITDQFFLGNRVNMDKLSYFYLNIINEDINSIKCKIPEVHLLNYLKINNIEYKIFYYNWIINFYDNYSYTNYSKFIHKIKDVFDTDCYINLML